MKILVTVAKGFIGKNLIDELRNRKYEEVFEYDLDSSEEELDRFWRGPVGKTTKAFGDLASGVTRGAQAARSNRESFESLNPVIEGAAAALSAIPIVGDALGKTFSTVGTFVTAELQKSVEAFQTLGSVGAVGAGGVTGLRKSAEEAGLAFDQLAKITKDNAQTLAFAFGSTSKGLESIADLTSAAEPFRRELLALGFGITEQTEVFADFIQISRRLGRAQSSDYRVLASGAAEYAKRLDRLSRLTGASTDALQAELDAQQTNIRFRRALRDLPDTAQDAISNIGIVIAKVGNDPALTQGFQDMVAGFGTEASRNFAIATQGVGPAVVEQLKAGAITEQQALKQIQQSLGKTFDTLPAQVLGLGTPFDATALGMANLADASEFTADRIRAIVKAQTDAKDATDDATGEMVNAQLSLQRFAQEADAFVNNQIFPKAVGVISTLTDSLSKLTGGINQLASGLPSARAAGGPVTSGEPYLVGELGPEIVVPKSSGTVIPTNQLVALFDQVQKMGGGSQLVPGMSQTFLPGIGYATGIQSGGMGTTKITDFAGAEIANKTSFSLDTMLGSMSGTASQYTAGPRDSYANEVFGRDMVSALTMGDFGGQKSTVLGEGDMFKTEALFKSMTEALTAELRTIAANTKTGADTSKQLLRASAG